MSSHPTSHELIDAVASFLNERAAPGLTGRDGFLAKVAANALAAVGRELEQGPGARAAAHKRLVGLLGHDGAFEALNAEFCDRLASGALTLASPDVLAHLKASTIDQVQIDQPNYTGLKHLLEGRD